MSSKANEIHQIKLADTEYAEITFTDKNGNEVAKIEFTRDVEATPQLQISYFDKDGNVTQSTTTYDVDA
jgi:hypothetical protein